MTRVLSAVALSILLPAAVSAQTPPPPPPLPPVPPVAPVAPTPPTPPPPLSPRALPPVPPVFVDTLAIDEAMRAVVRVDREMMREVQEQARIALEHTRIVTPEFVFHDALDFQPRYSDTQDPSGSYTSGLNAIGQRQWERAIAQFDRAIAQKSPRADAALYWKAYAQYRNSQVQEALATIAVLRKDYGQSPYLTDAKVLEADVRKTPPQELVDDEIKVLAISAQLHTEPARSVPLLEGVLTGTNSLRVKRHALFVLAQINDPKARQILMNYAKGAGLPDLQSIAIQYLAQDKKTSAADLQQIYNSTTNPLVKSAIINAYQQTGNRAALTAIVAQRPTGAPPGVAVEPANLRREALGALTGILSPQDLWQLYEKEQDVTLRRQIVGAFGSMRALDQLNQVIRTEKDPGVRRRAIQSLGGFKTEQTGPMLVEMYGRETDAENKRAIVNAIASQNNVDALIEIAKKESTPNVKLELIQRLSEMSKRSKAAADYLAEVLKGR
jgi:HEAT repeat protein